MLNPESRPFDKSNRSNFEEPALARLDSAEQSVGRLWAAAQKGKGNDMGLRIAGDQYRWPDGIIPFEIDPALPEPQRVRDAIAHWHEHTDIRFVEHNGEADYVYIARIPGAASSEIGRRGGRQEVALGDGCTVGGIIHELGHTVGLCHEHCRNDRGDWIDLDDSNIKHETKNSYKQNFVDGVDTPLTDVGPYDYGSIMHYGERDNALDDRDPVFRPKHPTDARIGQRDGLSPGDIAAVAVIYATS
jgi:hypothetical protein